MITVRDPRLSIIPADSNERQERVLRLANVEEHDHGLYRCVQGDVTLNEVLLDVLSECRARLAFAGNQRCFHMIVSSLF